MIFPVSFIFSSLIISLSFSLPFFSLLSLSLSLPPPQICETVVMYDTYLVWSGLAQNDMKYLFQYVSLAMSADKAIRDPVFPQNIVPSLDELGFLNLLKGIKAQV